MGTAGIEIYNGRRFEQESERDDVQVLQLLQKYFIRKVNVIYETFKFLTRNHNDTESTTAYVDKLRRLAKMCDIENITTCMQPSLRSG